MLDFFLGQNSIPNKYDCDQDHDHDLDYDCGSGILHCPCRRKWLETKDEVCLLWRHQTKQRQHQMIIICCWRWRWELFFCNDPDHLSLLLVWYALSFGCFPFEFWCCIFLQYEMFWCLMFSSMRCFDVVAGREVIKRWAHKSADNCPTVLSDRK